MRKIGKLTKFQYLCLATSAMGMLLGQVSVAQATGGPPPPPSGGPPPPPSHGAPPPPGGGAVGVPNMNALFGQIQMGTGLRNAADRKLPDKPLVDPKAATEKTGVDINDVLAKGKTIQSTPEDIAEKIKNDRAKKEAERKQAEALNKPTVTLRAVPADFKEKQRLAAEELKKFEEELKKINLGKSTFKITSYNFDAAGTVNADQQKLLDAAKILNPLIAAGKNEFNTVEDAIIDLIANKRARLTADQKKTINDALKVIAPAVDLVTVSQSFRDNLTKLVLEAANEMVVDKAFFDALTPDQQQFLQKANAKTAEDKKREELAEQKKKEAADRAKEYEQKRLQREQDRKDKLLEAQQLRDLVRKEKERIEELKEKDPVGYNKYLEDKKKEEQRRLDALKTPAQLAAEAKKADNLTKWAEAEKKRNEAAAEIRRAEEEKVAKEIRANNAKAAILGADNTALKSLLDVLQEIKDAKTVVADSADGPPPPPSSGPPPPPSSGPPKLKVNGKLSTSGANAQKASGQEETKPTPAQQMVLGIEKKAKEQAKNAIIEINDWIATTTDTFEEAEKVKLQEVKDISKKIKAICDGPDPKIKLSDEERKKLENIKLSDEDREKLEDIKNTIFSIKARIARDKSIANGTTPLTVEEFKAAEEAKKVKEAEEKRKAERNKPVDVAAIEAAKEKSREAREKAKEERAKKAAELAVILADPVKKAEYELMLKNKKEEREKKEKEEKELAKQAKIAAIKKKAEENKQNQQSKKGETPQQRSQKLVEENAINKEKLKSEIKNIIEQLRALGIEEKEIQALTAAYKADKKRLRALQDDTLTEEERKKLEEEEKARKAKKAKKAKKDKKADPDPDSDKANTEDSSLNENEQLARDREVALKSLKKKLAAEEEIDLANLLLQQEAEAEELKIAEQEVIARKEEIRTTSISAMQADPNKAAEIMQELSDNQVDLPSLIPLDKVGDDKEVSSLTKLDQSQLYLAVQQKLDKKEIKEQTDKLQQQAISFEALAAVVQGLNYRMDTLVLPIAQAAGDEAVAAGDEDDTRVVKGAWISGLYGNSQQGKIGKVSGYSSNIGGMTIGFDAEFNETATFGVAYSNARSGFKFKNDKKGDKLSAMSHIFSVYNQTNVGKGWIWQNTASLSNTKVVNKSLRLIAANTYKTATGKFKSTGYNFSTRLSYQLSLGEQLVMLPNAGMSYGAIHDGNYDESGVGIYNLSVPSKSRKSLVASVGTKFALPIVMNGSVVTPSVHVGVDKDFNNKVQKTKVRLKWADKAFDNEITSAKTSGIATDIGAGILLKSRNIEAQATYNLRLKEKFISNQVALRIKVLF